MNIKYYYRLNRDDRSKRAYITITDKTNIYLHHSIVSKKEISKVYNKIISTIFENTNSPLIEIKNNTIINMLNHKIHKELYISFRAIVVEDLNDKNILNRFEDVLRNSKNN